MRLPMMRIEGVDPKIFVTTSVGAEWSLYYKNYC